MFRKRKPAKLLSAEELKSKLFDHFDKTGSLNQMKTEIRGKLVTELFKMRPPMEPSGAQYPSGFDKTLLPLQVCNWLVYDHLLRQGYQYALSTFVSEASVSHPEQLLTASDILGLFRLDSGSSEYKNISRMYSVHNEREFLHSLLLAVVKSLLDSTSEDRNKDTTKASVVGDKPPFEASRFSDKSFSGDAVLEEQLQLLKEEKEKEVLALRQKWLQELDRLHSEEKSMREEVDLKKREIQRQLDDVFAEKEKLKEQEYFLIKEHENKLEKKTRELESKYLSEIHSVENELKVSQGKSRDKELRIAQVEADHAALQTNYNSLKRELEEIKQTYKATKEKYSSLLDENTKLLRKFESMSDYSIVKGDLEVRSNEVATLQRELEELKTTSVKERDSALEKVRNLEAKLKHEETLLAESQRQLSNCRETMTREEAVWHRERKKLESESFESKKMYENLIKRIEEQRDDIQALHQTIHVLHYQLTSSNKRHETKPKLTGVIPPVTNRAEPRMLRINSSPEDTSAYTTDSLKFIEEARGRIRSLEKEADALRNKHFSDFTVPSVESMQDKGGFGSLIYNLSNIPNVPIKTQSTSDYKNFENLIHNEIPTLNSCLLSRKSYANCVAMSEKDLRFSSSGEHWRSAEMRQDIAPLFSGLSSVNIQASNLAFRNPEDAVHRSVEKEPSLPLNIDQGKTSYSQQNSDNMLSSLVKEKPELKSQESRLSVQNESGNHAMQYQTSEMSDAVLGNLNKPTGMMSGIDSNSNASGVELSEHKFDSLKTSEQREPNKDESLHTGSPFKADSLKLDDSKSQDSNVGLADSALSSDVSLKPVEVNLDAAWKKQLLKDTPQSTFPVIDLDSAWKRKSSLKDNSENQSLPAFFSSIDSVWRRKSVISPIHSKASTMSSTPRKMAEGKHYSEEGGEKEQLENDSLLSIAPEDSTTTLTHVEGSHLNKKDFKNSEISSSSQKDPNASTLSTESELSSTPGDHLEGSNRNHSLHDPLKDPIEENPVVLDEHALEIYSSEASDIHLSCGSEQEQQKEDLDNW